MHASSSRRPTQCSVLTLRAARRLQKYAAAFADAGFAVFVFDYRYWGGSEGLPRQWISPRRQLEDWASAISYVQGDLASKVDTSKLSLWGTSFAGGHVITMAARLGSQVKAVVSQVRPAATDSSGNDSSR